MYHRVLPCISYGPIGLALNGLCTIPYFGVRTSESGPKGDEDSPQSVPALGQLQGPLRGVCTISQLLPGGQAKQPRHYVQLLAAYRAPSMEGLYRRNGNPLSVQLLAEILLSLQTS